MEWSGNHPANGSGLGIKADEFGLEVEMQSLPDEQGFAIRRECGRAEESLEILFGLRVFEGGAPDGFARGGIEAEDGPITTGRIQHGGGTIDGIAANDGRGQHHGVFLAGIFPEGLQSDR